MTDIVHVAVAVIVNECGEVCISLRHDDSHQGGKWEFPGGKIEQHETVEQALVREIKEELNLDIKASRPLITIRHDYHDKKVCLHVNKVLDFYGHATGVEGQQVKWLSVNQLAALDFPDANAPIIKAVALPDKYLITGKFIDEQDFIIKLSRALDYGIRLVQLRLKKGDIKSDSFPALFLRVTSMCEKVDAKLMLNIPESLLHTVDHSSYRFVGIHADSQTLRAMSERPLDGLFSASCHNDTELLKAKQLNADFAVLSPVQKTASHPDMPAMGWVRFSEMLEPCAMPVYALGGVSEKDMQTAWLNGAQGIAAISAFWK